MEPADFTNFDTVAAQQFLDELPPETRKRGDALVNAGAVKEFRCVAPGLEYVADIEGDIAAPDHADL